MTLIKIASYTVRGTLCALVALGTGCSASDTDAADDSTDSVTGASSGCPGTVSESLVGSAINGAVPQGRASANESAFCSGGSSTLTVQVSGVKLPDGTALGVTLDFEPMGTILLRGGSGSMTTSLGHFAVTHDNVRVNEGGTTILIGGSFR